MALNKSLIPQNDSRSFKFESEGAESDTDLEQLEWEVKQIAQKVVHYRSTLPDQLKSTFANILHSQRPVGADGLEPGTSGANQQDGVEQVIPSEVAVLDKDEQDTAKKVQLLKDKISSNVSIMPTVLKRMKDCISAIDKLDSDDVVIHPAFKRKKAG